MAMRDVVYGRNPVREALRGLRRVRRIWVAAASDLTDGEVGSWPHEGQEDPPIEEVSAERLFDLVGTMEHQGIGAEVEPFTYRNPDEVLSTHDLIVVLDKVQDPHNLGAVIRTAEGAGAAVVFPRHRSAHVTPAVVKASAGATEHATLCRVRNTADFLISSRDGGFWSYGAVAEAPGCYYEQDYEDATIFVLGSEGSGISRRVAKECDQLVGIPLAGATSSLNVSVACGVLLFEAARQRSFRGFPGSSREQGELP